GLPGWVNHGYNFWFSSSATAQDANQANFPLGLWGPLNGSSNGLGESPQGGAFIALDGAFATGPIEQSVNGMVAGDSYTLSFYWAASQEYSFNGNTQQSLTASFGDQSHTTSTVNLGNHAFSGWTQETWNFTWDGNSSTLSFLAQGSPAVPPFTLVDGVSLVDNTTTPSAVPEPSTILSSLLGVAGLAVYGLRRRASSIARE
ncbi:MAG: PEP-CTERM sorting domain-containing protein, partial [Actinomycetota bacterium]